MLMTRTHFSSPWMVRGNRSGHCHWPGIKFPSGPNSPVFSQCFKSCEAKKATRSVMVMATLHPPRMGLGNTLGSRKIRSSPLESTGFPRYFKKLRKPGSFEAARDCCSMWLWLVYMATRGGFSRVPRPVTFSLSYTAEPEKAAPSLSG